MHGILTANKYSCEDVWRFMVLMRILLLVTFSKKEDLEHDYSEWGSRMSL